jgi:hypothetical protein
MTPQNLRHYTLESEDYPSHIHTNVQLAAVKTIVLPPKQKMEEYFLQERHKEQVADYFLGLYVLVVNYIPINEQELNHVENEGYSFAFAVSFVESAGLHLEHNDKCMEYAQNRHPDELLILLLYLIYPNTNDRPE